jgi:hypothetical protein
MFEFIRNRFKSKGHQTPADNVMNESGGRNTFAKYYMPFRTVVIFAGTIPGVFIAWPLVIFLVSMSPDFIGEAMGDGINWFVDQVLMFGHAAEYPKLSFWMTLLLPSFFAYALILIENFVYPFVAKDKVQDF